MIDSKDVAAEGGASGTSMQGRFDHVECQECGSYYVCERCGGNEPEIVYSPVEAEVRSLRSQDDPTDAGIDEAAHELQRVIVECGGDSTECAYDYLRGILAKLPATRAPSVPTTEQFVDCYVCGRKMDGSSEDDCHCFHRKQILAAPATKPLDDPRLQELFGAAISGAMSLGFLNQSPPPEGHWLTQHWNTGRETALAGASFAGSGVGRPLDDAATKP